MYDEAKVKSTLLLDESKLIYPMKQDNHMRWEFHLNAGDNFNKSKWVIKLSFICN